MYIQLSDYAPHDDERCGCLTTVRLTVEALLLFFNLYRLICHRNADDEFKSLQDNPSRGGKYHHFRPSKLTWFWHRTVQSTWYVIHKLVCCFTVPRSWHHNAWYIFCHVYNFIDSSLYKISIPQKVLKLAALVSDSWQKKL